MTNELAEKTNIASHGRQGLNRSAAAAMCK